jgi:hypothetical protein
MRNATLLVISLSVAAGFASAQASAPAAVQPATPCEEPERRQLDFWIGKWDVYNTADGVRYASSLVESIVGGCAISEFYDSPKAPSGPYVGKSYSSFDPKDGHWHQFYVDVNGNATWYTGSLTEVGALTMTAKGPKAMQEMSYVPQPDGSVRQIGRFSTDDGQTWQTGYDYTYRRRAD